MSEKPDTLALDRESVRTKDQDGHLHIGSSVVSAAQVNDYLCEEINGWETLGLTPGHVYALLRDPLELEKGAATLHGKPLVIVHRAQTADDHDREITVGSVSNPIWDSPNLKAEITVWDGEAIALIESKEQADLSAGYHYDPVMVPGEYNGVQFDGRMTNILFNHLALVTQGRVIGAIVGDSAICKETAKMSKIVLSRKAALAQGALTVFLKPRLAADAKLDLSPVLKDVTAKNWLAIKPTIVADIRRITTGKLAKDAKLDEMHDALDSIDKEEPAEDEGNSGVPLAAKDKAKDEEKGDKAKDAAHEFLKSKLSEDEMEAYDAMCEGQEAMDEEEDDKDKKKEEAKDKGAKDKGARDKAKDAAEEPEKMDKKAMDAAIARGIAAAAPGIAKAAHDAAMKTQRELQEAIDVVAPVVGKLAMAHDSAEAVYRTALTVKGVNLDGVHPSAFRAMVDLLPKQGAAPQRENIAMDAKGVSSFKEMFGDVKPVVRL